MCPGLSNVRCTSPTLLRELRGRLLAPSFLCRTSARENAIDNGWSGAFDFIPRPVGPFYRWIPVLRTSLQAFNCVRVDAGSAGMPLPSPFDGSWLQQDVDQRCFEGAHLKYSVAAGVIGLLICSMVRG